MKLEEVLQGELVSLQPYEANRVTQQYVDWLNEAKVNQYVEARFKKYTLDDERKYVQDILDSDTEMLMAIAAHANDTVIGSVRITLNKTHKRCSIAYMIGDMSYWGKGIATDCIKLATRWCFENLDIYRMEADYYSANAGSGKALMRAGYKQEGVRAGYCLLDDGTRADVISVGLTRDDFEALNYSK